MLLSPCGQFNPGCRKFRGSKWNLAREISFCCCSHQFCRSIAMESVLKSFERFTQILTVFDLVRAESAKVA